MLRRLRFAASICLIYVATIGTIAGISQSSRFLVQPAVAEPPMPHQQHIVKKPVVISGKPTRITIETTTIDLPLVNGTYDTETNSWTLSETEAQYATMSALANNQQGTTFIYGHGTAAVFGEISEQHPALGTLAHVATDSGRIFTYSLVDVHDYTPNDTSMLSDLGSGASRLVVQTCSGALSQWRTMFIFEYEGVK